MRQAEKIGKKAGECAARSLDFINVTSVKQLRVREFWLFDSR